MLKGLCVFSKNIENTKKAGFDYVVLPGFEVAAMSDESFEKLVKKVKEIDIPVLGYNSYCKDDLPIVGDGFNEEKTAAYAALLSKRAYELGIKNIGIGAPAARRLPKDYDKIKAYNQGKKFISITAYEARKYGLNVLIEGLQKYYCDFVNYIPEAYQLMKDIDRTNVKMIIDFYHMKVNGEEYQNALGLLDYCKDVHISGCDKERNRPFVDETDAEDLKLISSILKKGGYNLTLTLEPDNTDENFMEKAQNSYNVINKYFE